MLTLAACAFWLASKVAKMLAGTLRCGSGMTGFGGVWASRRSSSACWASCALICTLPSRLGRRLRNRARSARKSAPRSRWMPAISNVPVRDACATGANCCAHFGIFGFYSTQSPADWSILSRFRRKEISFFRENRMSVAILWLATLLKSRFLLPRSESRVCRRDWPGRRCLQVPFVPSARRRDCSRFAAAAECSSWKPCGRA